MHALSLLFPRHHFTPTVLAVSLLSVAIRLRQEHELAGPLFRSSMGKSIQIVSILRILLTPKRKESKIQHRFQKEEVCEILAFMGCTEWLKL